MKSRLHEHLKEVLQNKSFQADTLMELATATKQAGVVDISAGLESRIKYKVNAPSASIQYFEDGLLRFNDLADAAVRRQVQTYVVGANILISGIRAGISGDPTAFLNIITQVVSLMDSVSDE
jgi:hypothetical protein